MPNGNPPDQNLPGPGSGVGADPKEGGGSGGEGKSSDGGPPGTREPADGHKAPSTDGGKSRPGEQETADIRKTVQDPVWNTNHPQGTKSAFATSGPSRPTQRISSWEEFERQQRWPQGLKEVTQDILKQAVAGADAAAPLLIIETTVDDFGVLASRVLAPDVPLHILDLVGGSKSEPEEQLTILARLLRDCVKESMGSDATLVLLGRRRVERDPFWKYAAVSRAQIERTLQDVGLGRLYLVVLASPEVREYRGRWCADWPVLSLQDLDLMKQIISCRQLDLRAYVRNTQDLTVALEEQIDLGLWGDAEIEAPGRLWLATTSGKLSLEFAKKREQSQKDQAGDHIGKWNDVFDAAVLSRSPARTAALFLATYFEDLGVEAFRSLAGSLINRIEQDWPPEKNEDSDEARPAAPTLNDGILHTCRLFVGTSSLSRRQVVHFQELSLARKYFRDRFQDSGPIARRLCFEGLCDAIALGHPDEMVHKGLLALLQELAESEDAEPTEIVKLLTHLLFGPAAPDGIPLEEVGNLSAEQKRRFWWAALRAPEVVAELFERIKHRLGDSANEIWQWIVAMIARSQPENQPNEPCQVRDELTPWIILSLLARPKGLSLETAVLAPLSEVSKTRRMQALNYLTGLGLMDPILVEIPPDRYQELLVAAARAVTKIDNTGSGMLAYSHLFSCQVFLRLLVRSLLPYSAFTEHDAAVERTEEAWKWNDAPPQDGEKPFDCIILEALMHPPMARYLRGFREAEYSAMPSDLIDCEMRAGAITFDLSLRILRAALGCDALGDKEWSALKAFVDRIDPPGGLPHGFGAPTRWTPSGQARDMARGIYSEKLIPFDEASMRWVESLPLLVLMLLSSHETEDGRNEVHMSEALRLFLGEKTQTDQGPVPRVRFLARFIEGMRMDMRNWKIALDRLRERAGPPAVEALAVRERRLLALRDFLQVPTSAR